MNNFQSISFSVKQQMEEVEEHFEMARKMEQLDHEINKQENKLQDIRCEGKEGREKKGVGRKDEQRGRRGEERGYTMGRKGGGERGSVKEGLGSLFAQANNFP